MARQGQPTDAALVRRCRAGDRKAFTRLVRRYQGAAYAAAVSRVGSHHDAMDVVQDAFIAAYCKLGQLRRGERFGPWFRTIVRRRALEWIRARRRQPGSAGRVTDGQAGLERVLQKDHDRQQRQAELQEALGALPEKYREVVLLRYLEHWPYSRIARFTGLPASTVKGRLQVARARLKEALSPTAERARVMARSEMEKKVEQTLCQIATEEVHQVIPTGDTRQVVLYYDLHADIEVCCTDGDDVVVNGTKASIGLSEEDARASIDGIRILWDEVEDYAQTGPHPGKVFSGTKTDDDGNPVAIVKDVAALWPDFGAPSFRHGRLYPELDIDDQTIMDSIRSSLGNVTRISITREEVDDIILPREMFTESVRRVFYPTWILPERIHGPRGHVSLTIGMPVGKGLTVLTKAIGSRIEVRGLRSNVCVWGPASVELADVEGDVCILGASVPRAEGIRGRFLMNHYSFGGSEWSNDMMCHPMTVSTRLRDICGEVRADFGKAELEVSDLSGDVMIRNRFGSTRYYQNTHHPGSRCRIESDSGPVTVFLKEDLIGSFALAVTTMCGTIDHRALKELDRPNKRNDIQVAMFATVDGHFASEEVLSAELYVRTRDGNVTIEKTV